MHKIDLAKTKRIIAKIKDSEYRKRVGAEGKVVDSFQEDKDRDGYFYYEMKDKKHLPPLCPKCYMGEVTEREFKCINSIKPEDAFLISFIRCDAGEDCDFISNEKITKITNTMVQSELDKVAKAKATREERATKLAKLKDGVRENSWTNLTKAIYSKSRVMVVSGALLVIMAFVMMSYTLIAGVKPRSLSTNLKQGSFEISIQDQNLPEVCREYIQEKNE